MLLPGAKAGVIVCVLVLELSAAPSQKSLKVNFGLLSGIEQNAVDLPDVDWEENSKCGI